MTFIIAQNQTGPLPLKIPFNAPMDGDVTIAFSGTCWSNAQGTGGVQVYLDGTHIGDALLCFNTPGVHLTLPTQFFAVTLTEGPHTIALQPQSANTVSDKNDFYSLWIVD